MLRPDTSPRRARSGTAAGGWRPNRRAPSAAPPGAAWPASPDRRPRASACRRRASSRKPARRHRPGGALAGGGGQLVAHPGRWRLAGLRDEARRRQADALGRRSGEAGHAAPGGAADGARRFGRHPPAAVPDRARLGLVSGRSMLRPSYRRSAMFRIRQPLDVLVKVIVWRRRVSPWAPPPAGTYVYRVCTSAVASVPRTTLRRSIV